jgi:peptide chain release factor 2
MQDLINTATNLANQLKDITTTLNLPKLNQELVALQKLQNNPDFWLNNDKAQKIVQQINKLQLKIEPCLKLQNELNEIIELAGLGDESIKEQLYNQIYQCEIRLNQINHDLKFSGPYDDYNAILNIYAGAGGTDAQDWAQMLQRMYLKWAEKQNLKATIISESNGEEAGIKSATLLIVGPLAYGKLKAEHGVHRLVRLSPFNSGATRETSFAKVDVLPEIDQPEDVIIDDKDLKIDVYRAGGHGGQSVNTTDSAVRITHLPTNITVAIQNERSQLQNKETALTILRSRLVQLQLEQHKESIAEIKGPNEQASWGNQIRNYVLHPYTIVKDTRTKAETSDVQGVLDGDLSKFI